MTHFTMPLTAMGRTVETAMTAILVGTMLLSLATARRGVEPNAHAPCYDCEFYHLMHRDQGFHEKQVTIYFCSKHLPN